MGRWGSDEESIGRAVTRIWGVGTREGSVAKGWVMQRAMIAVVEPSAPVWVVWLLLALRKVPLEVQVFW